MGPPRTYIRVHDSDPTPDLRVPFAAPLTWKRIFLMLSMAVLTAGSGVIGSHIGGATKDDVRAAVAPLATKDDVRDAVKAAIAAESDSMKAYVDGKMEAGRQPSARVARRKHQQPGSDE